MTAVPKPPPAFDRDSRRRNLARLASDLLDVLIIGGGINGAGIARDLGLRASAARTPLRIGLIEKRHFGSGTSSRNSQLIHGGLRYLEHFDFGLVREALRERATLIEIAPHLVEPLPFLIPFSGWFQRRYYGLGLWLYDLLAGGHNIGSRKYFSAEEVRNLEPDLSPDRLHSAAIYFDCRVHSARLLLENIFDAARAGATVANYAEAVSWRRQGDGFQVEVADQLGGEPFTVGARRLVDARGPWEGGDRIRLVRGSHLVLPSLTRSSYAIAHFHTDGRIIFVIPWGPDESLSLVGTTDADHDASADDVQVSPEEIRYLLGIVRGLFPGAGSVEPLAAYSSLRPLLATGAKSASAATRAHKIWMEDGIVKIAGGKYTTYRAMSAEAVDLLAGDLASSLLGRCATAHTALGGNSTEVFHAELDRASELAAHCGEDPARIDEVIRLYGVQAESLLSNLDAEAPQGLSRLEAAIIRWAVEHEMAQRLPDLLFVSTYWGHQRLWGRESLRPYAVSMGNIVGWSRERIEEEIALTLRISSFPAF